MDITDITYIRWWIQNHASNKDFNAQLLQHQLDVYAVRPHVVAKERILQEFLVFHVNVYTKNPGNTCVDRAILSKKGEKMTQNDLIYAAVKRCLCGAGLACIPDTQEWKCSRILLGTADMQKIHIDTIPISHYATILVENTPLAWGATTRPE